jgi:parallel beta-helix repeat protein
MSRAERGSILQWSACWPVAFGLWAAVLPAPVTGQQPVPLVPGMVVTESTRIRPDTYRLPAPQSLDSALVVVRGEGVTLDLTGVVLEGTEPSADPDQAAGVAIRVEGGRSVTIRGGTIRGYKIGILALGTRNFRVLDIDLSYNWKPRLFSRVSHESLIDWLSYHDNEDRQWMRFGAALYLEGVRGGEISRVRSLQGMNALLMTRSDSVLIRENDFSYNSGLGIGLYRSSYNVIIRNRMDYDVRGYSHGVYQRGQDSAGLLLYEQSSNNVVAYNSATHSGDGLFLWAGNSTMDTGEGGANDNLFFYNDFSFAPTNGIEVTFSRNRMLGNIVEGNRYGVWGGYSWESEILGNCFARNQYGVAIEHGQDNRIVGNRFDGDSLAVSLWSRESEPEDWGYPRHRDTASRDHLIADNVFAGVNSVWRLEGTRGVDVLDNRVESGAGGGAGSGAATTSTGCDPRALLGDAFSVLADDLFGVPPNTPRQIPYSPRSRLPRSAIVVDEWGPFDGLSPKLWTVDTAQAEVRLAVLGPEGRWVVTGQRGIESLATESGTTGDTLVVIPEGESMGDWMVELEYRGDEVVSPRGQVVRAGESVPFRFERFEPISEWSVRYFRWRRGSSHPQSDPSGFRALLTGEPILRRTLPRLDFTWYTPWIPELPVERWALEARATVDLPPGAYSLRTISDDGVRVWVDGELAIDHWDDHGSEVDYAPLPPGRHDLRVQYYQIGGWSELRVDVVKGSPRSTGSAGPH